MTQRSLSEYDALNNLLHSGKSGRMLSSSVRASAGLHVAGSLDDRRHVDPLVVGSKRQIAANVMRDIVGARHVTHHSEITGDLGGQSARALQAIGDERVVAADLHDLFEITDDALDRRNDARRRRQAEWRMEASTRQEFVPLANLNDVAFGGWDIFQEDCYTAARLDR